MDSQAAFDRWAAYDPDRVHDRVPFDQLIQELAERTGRPLWKVENVSTSSIGKLANHRRR